MLAKKQQPKNRENLKEHEYSDVADNLVRCVINVANTYMSHNTCS